MSQTYASTVLDDGVDYRNIAMTLTNMGFPMGHSTVRNVVIRVMRQMLSMLAHEYDIDLDDNTVSEIASSPKFQNFVSEIMQIIELNRLAKKAM